ncbi:HD domain-containing phosphohydrolase [Halobacteriovorax sp. RZ-1]|uniref:HD domain-containing phosphohydrolase n=1 Tax=unclassified Halobacteriovorax TaxID=2639665 RepID=UPI003721BB60
MIRALYITDEDINKDNYLRSNLPKDVELVKVNSKEEAIDQVLSKGPFQIGLIDVENKNISAMDLMTTYSELVDDMDFVFFGNSSLYAGNIESQLDDELMHLAHHLEYPFNEEALDNVFMDIILKYKRIEENAAVIEIDESEFAPLKLRSLYLFKSIPADAYIKFTSHKFMKVIKKNAVITEALIQSFVKRKVKFVCLYKSDQLQILEDAITEMYITLDKHKDTKVLLENLIRSVGIIHSYLRWIGTGDAVLSLVDKVIEKCELVIEKEPDLLTLLSKFPFTAGDVAEKSLLTSLFGCSILESINYKASGTRSKIILSAILCDSTLENDDLCKINSVKDPNLRMFSEEEQEEFKIHPVREGELASLFTKYPEVDFILHQHHEQPDGSGFPVGLRGKKITLISAIFILSNDFASYIIQRGLKRSVLRKAAEVLEEKYAYVPFKEPFKMLTKKLA